MTQYTQQNLSTEGSVTYVPEDMRSVPLLRYFLPNFMWGDRKLLPNALPPETFYQFFSQRHQLLLSTLEHEEVWASVVGKATNKMASKDWQVNSPVKLRAKNMKDLLNRASAGTGLIGWNQFVQSSVASFILLGISYIEIQRDGNGRIMNLRTLDPLRCRVRNDPWKPVSYLPEYGGDERVLTRDEVWLITDQPSPTQGESYGDLVNSAAIRAYKAIVRMNSISWYINEKVRGDQPLSMYFLGGGTRSTVDDGLKMAQADADSRGRSTYRGAAVVPIPTDTAISLVEVPFSSLPDKFNITEEREAAQLVYALSLGLDPQEVNPKLISGGSIGTGSQAKVLADKDRGNAMASWTKQMVSLVNSLDPKITFSFIEDDLDDQLQEAKVALAWAEAIERIKFVTGLTQDEALTIFVDKGILNPEFQFAGADASHTSQDDINEGSIPPRRSEPRPEPQPTVNPETGEVEEPEEPTRGRTRLAPEIGRVQRMQKEGYSERKGYFYSY